ncbi:MAG: hypothetical protein QT04_C0046G0011 [archaeon GW2011_AR11]|nr:MAG: hypothetical protein QT04_C0046G0011 [archaeon GW2011_AR11]
MTNTIFPMEESHTRLFFIIFPMCCHYPDKAENVPEFFTHHYLLPFIRNAVRISWSSTPWRFRV